MKRLIAIVVACMALSGAALAQAGDEGDGLQRILKQQHALKADLDDGGIDGLTARQGSAIRKAQAEVFALTEGKAALADLSMDQKVQLENALERINAQVKNSKAGHDEQQVCWREQKSGSSVKVTRCGTEAERREAREGARDFLERPKVCGERCG
ncbi:hypothetical protein ACFQZQ_11260 [Lysobacter koreensis]|uniref:Uncharacterized protein n=1 Tax=Lysobacter koreensis TaxID=266122 RepID=A0ABW2YP80_9GAMM